MKEENQGKTRRKRRIRAEACVYDVWSGNVNS
jgi:hypothetical protein